MPNQFRQAAYSLELVDHFDRVVTERHFRGCHVLFLFGCTDFQLRHPSSLRRVAEGLDRLGERPDGLRAYYVTVDPFRDTAARLRSFLEPWPQFIGLTGMRDQVHGLLTTLNAGLDQWTLRQNGPHDAITHLVGPTGLRTDWWPDVLSPGEIEDRLHNFLFCPHTS